MNVAIKDRTVFIGTLLLVAFCSHFIFINQYGLYEDDYVFINLGWSIQELAGRLENALLHWPSGRPIGHIIPFSIGYLGKVFNSLIPVYIFGYLFIAANSVLIFCILRLITADVIAFTGALTYIVFPADTTRILLIHSLGIQSGLMFTLIAGLLYLKNMKAYAYLVSIMALLTYETTWLPFVLMPLLKGNISRQWLVSWLKHALILGLILAVVIAIRMSMGETRVVNVADADSFTLFVKSVSLLFIGPLVSGLTFLIRPYTAIVDGTPFSWFMIVIMAVFLFGVFKKVTARASSFDESAAGETVVTGPAWMQLTAGSQVQDGIRMIVVGLAMWMSVYALSYSHWPAFEIAGRLTSVHIAASIPTAIIVAGVVCLLVNFFRTARQRTVLFSIVSVYLALLAGFHIVVQNDYVRSWQYTKVYWQKILKLVPDISPGTQVFIMKVGDFPRSTYVENHSWADYMLLGRIYDIDTRDSALLPKVNVISSANIKSFKVEDGKLVRFSKRPKPGGGTETVTEVLDPAKLVFLLYKEDGTMIRLRHSVTLGRLRIPLPPPGKKTDFPPTLLYRLIMD